MCVTVEVWVVTMPGSTVMSQEQLVPGGYLFMGQPGVVISPWALVILPPQNCCSGLVKVEN